MGRLSLRSFKYCLTQVGARLSPRALTGIQASVNYLRVGRWMLDHNYSFGHRVPSRLEVWRAILDRVRDRKVLYLEFGVASGASMKHWVRELRHKESALYGFDSFEGLPEESGPWQKGQFSSAGRIPAISDSRLTFVKGWFDQTLPSFVCPP